MSAAQELVTYLREKKLSICTAESCTGGLIAASIVDIPGASEIFEEGYITYSDFAKMKILGVSSDTIRQYSVVSSPVAEEMAEGAAKKSRADIAVAITGYAGPGAAEDGTVAGTVYIGICYQEHTYSYHLRLDGGRNEVRRQAADEALALVLETLQNGG